MSAQINEMKMETWEQKSKSDNLSVVAIAVECTNQRDCECQNLSEYKIKPTSNQSWESSAPDPAKE